MIKKVITVLAAWIVIVGGVFWFIHRQPATQTTTQNHKLRVVTTNSILEDMVHNIGKDRIELYSIVKRGTDPHEYDPRPQDVSKTSAADLVFHNGLNLETGGSGWFKKLVQTSHKTFGKDVISASGQVKALHLTTNVNEKDPHAWLDLANGIKYVQTMSKAMQKADPKNAKFYQRNTKTYVAKLQKLHETAQLKFKDIPAKQRLLVTSEGAFKYFSKAYHVTPAYIWEINTESQGTPAQIRSVLKKIDNSDVKSLFVESSVSPKSMQKVAKSTGLKIHAKIFTDSLASKGSTGDTYYTMMKWNLDQIYGGLTNN
ncbi:Manganese ABC transporter substrate-binding lipoprotein [Lactobacillus casei W56] [Lactiplantibacillus mudanjiangensis]|uniref:metal ABC transporter solute-binding protein, Zn/Mn family n=1 Tax=Lactiplantibacillus mudanjiangensis TaxID=1296538 RepID=UPI001015B9AA|nr:Manganese ABC transporter substrate-binding lipoprotein [Lactobacillus casei W56] [Lactiplantibacillus mudanjiangensis]